MDTKATFLVGSSQHARWQLRDEAASHIRSLILSGRLLPGRYVRLQPLAQEFGSSVTPIREAMMMLREQGFVDLVPRRGFMVREVTTEDIHDLFLIQSLIGSELAARAASHMDSRKLAKLEEMQTRLEGIARDGSGRDFEHWNDAFHDAINEHAESPRLVWLYKAALPLPRYFSTVPGWTDMSIADHREILRAMSHHDVASARVAMADHVRRAGDLLASYLESEGRWPDGVH